jgi:hypothetical protein
MSNLLPGQPVAIERKRLLGLVLRDSVSSSLYGEESEIVFITLCISAMAISL